MRVHFAMLELTPDLIPILRVNAEKVGLDQVNYELTYNLYKVGSKYSSKMGYPDEFLACRNGSISLVGDAKLVAIYIENHKEWFRTSNIVSVKKIEKGYAVETDNSFYELRTNYDN